MLTDEESKEFRKTLKRIGRNIRKAREEKRLTQEEVSERIGVNVKNYQRIEYGERPISTRNLFRIARRLDVSLERLVG
jgi:transcriptional regulator with XRE-family HTH domain